MRSNFSSCYLMLDFYVKTEIKFSLRDKQLFEITEVEITRVDCIYFLNSTYFSFNQIKSNKFSCFFCC